MRRLLLAALLCLWASSAGAEKLASTVSTSMVQITSSFDGALLSFFGSIEPDVAGEALTGPYNVIIVITGPLQDRVARRKTNSFGIWTNTEQVSFKQFPSFYEVIASGKLDAITDPGFLDAEGILPSAVARAASAEGETPRAQQFGAELVRLMSEEGHFGVQEGSIQFLSPTAYTAKLNLPSDVANGPFLAHTYVLKGKQLVAETSEGFSVRKTGIENYVFVASRTQPLLYGLVCVALALGTGWLAGVVFRR